MANHCNFYIAPLQGPLPPTSLNATALGFDMISISWSHFSPETVEYTVHVNRQCSPDKQNYVSYNATSGTSRINVLSLTPFTVYCIDVIATSTDANLESAPSQVVSVRTLEAGKVYVYAFTVVVSHDLLTD